MSTFKVSLVQRVWEGCTVEVEAPTPEQAELAALKCAQLGMVEWDLLPSPDELAITSIDRVKEAA